MPGCLTTLAKATVSPLSITLAISGIGMIVAGIMAPKQIETILPTIFNTLKGVIGDFLPVDSFKTPIMNAVDPLSKVAIYFGAVLVGVGGFGVVAICLKNSTILRLHGVLALMIAGIFAITIFQFTNGNMETNIKASLKKTIKEDYYGALNKNATSLVWTLITTLFQCCGVDSYEDFNVTDHWNRTEEFMNFTLYPLVTPLSCCITNASKELPPLPSLSISNLANLTTMLPSYLKDVIGKIKDIVLEPFLNPECAKDPTPLNSNYKKGCWERITLKFAKVFEILKYVMYGFIGATVLIGLVSIGASFETLKKID